MITDKFIFDLGSSSHILTIILFHQSWNHARDIPEDKLPCSTDDIVNRGWNSTENLQSVAASK